MAWTYEQLFNDLTTGDLTGQDSWSGAVQYDVSTTNPYEGAKCVQITGDSTERQISRTITEVTSGIFYISIRSGDTGHLFGLKIYTNTGGQLTTIWFHSTGPRIWYYNGGTPTDLLNPFTANTWYRIGIDINGTGKNFKINLNGGAWSDTRSYQTAGSGTGGVYLLLFELAASYSGNAAFDSLSPNYTPVVASAPSIESDLVIFN